MGEKKEGMGITRKLLEAEKPISSVAWCVAGNRRPCGDRKSEGTGAGSREREP